jgi:plasmid stabilization system protein ParE
VAKNSATVSIAECESGFARLAAFPEGGTRVRLKHAQLEDCRFILVPGFEKMLIFYKLTDEKIQIVRVLHGARDIESVLDEGSFELRHNFAVWQGYALNGRQQPLPVCIWLLL